MREGGGLVEHLVRLELTARRGLGHGDPSSLP
jgi:hypothetical protein